MKNYCLLFTVVFVCNLLLHAEDSIMYNYDATMPSYVSFETGDSVYRSNQKAIRRPLTAKQILCRHLPLNAETSVVEVDTMFDEFGDKHIRFEQSYNGVKVDGQRYYLHYEGVDSKNMNGNFRTVAGVNTTPAISESVALDHAVEFLGADEYAWENDTAELFLRDDTGDSLATYYPHGELVIMFDSVQIPKLVYKFNILTLQPSGSFLVYINAQNGTVELAENLLQSIGQYTGTADTRFYGTRNIITDREIGKYRLHDHSRGHIITRNMRGKRYETSSPNYYDNDNNWTAAEYHANKDDAALTAHWAAEMTYDYFNVKFGRKGWDGKNGLLRLYVNAPLDQYSGDNAYWNGWGVTCGIGTNQSYVSLDIVAHEIGHAMMDKTANLRYRGESGALNEGFSDIWGACVENYVFQDKGDSIWQHGIDRGKINRNLYNPILTHTPNTYMGTYWQSTVNVTDYGGVHCNSTVFSHWFYLLAQGGTGTNDNNDSYHIEGIGIDKAARIAYNMLTSGLTEESDFADARRVAIDKAKSYGTNSHELIAVQNAWYAVGVGAPYVEIEGDADICDGEYEYTLKNCPDDATVRWTAVKGIYIVDSTRTSVVVERVPGHWVRRGFITVYRPPFRGTAQLQAEIIQNGVVVSTGIKNIEVHPNLTPAIKRDTTKSLYIRIPQNFSVTNFSEEDSLNLVWKVIKPNGTEVDLGTGLSKTYTGTTTGTHQIVVTNTDGCEPDNTATLSFTLMRRIKKMVYSNPVSYSVDITILEQDDDEVTLGVVLPTSPYAGEYTLELWSELYGRVRAVEADTPTTQMSLSGLNAGTYFLKLIINNEIVATQQLIIK